MKAAWDAGFSPRRFEGWSPTTTTRYRYNDDGTIAEQIVQVEPEFDDDDRAMIAALLDLEADTCIGCGLPRSETITILPEQSDAGTREWFQLPHNRKRRYRGTFATCQGCVAKNKAAAAQQAEDDKSKTPAYIAESRVWITRARTDFPDIPQLNE